MEFLNFLKTLAKLKVVWILYFEDEDSEELANYFSDIVKVKFEIKRADVDEIPLFDKAYYI